jgi:hypothetical protein
MNKLFIFDLAKLKVIMTSRKIDHNSPSETREPIIHVETLIKYLYIARIYTREGPVAQPGGVAACGAVGPGFKSRRARHARFLFVWLVFCL